LGSRAPRSDEVRQRLFQAVDLLNTSTREESSRKLFAELRGFLGGLPPELASTAIREFLDGNLDAPSRLGFKVGPDGFLTQRSSLRVFLGQRQLFFDVSDN
jgi:hypothetical protein